MDNASGPERWPASRRASLRRRAFLGRALRTAALCAGWGTAGLAAAFDVPPSGVFGRGRKIGTVPFEGSHRRLGVTFGRGLGGRRLLDLSTLTPETLVTPNDHFYIRTRYPDRIDDSRPWTVRVHGLVEEPMEIPAETLAGEAQPRGVHLLECSGNGGSFGLISAAEWSGVPVTSVIERARPRSSATRVLISGFDEHSTAAPGSPEPGASWVFSVDQLRETGAFFATRMNGRRLPRDHGFPVRLVVPGWYGCTCIKWVDEIRLVDDDARPTRHMSEYAGRTHQHGAPRLAHDYIPAAIDLAAIAVRVERWRVDDETLYRVVGLIWGGDRTTDALAIRWRKQPRDGAGDAGGQLERVADCDHRTTRTWSMWSHPWRPDAPGRYRIGLRVDDPAIRTRRLDRGFYDRTVVLPAG